MNKKTSPCITTVIGLVLLAAGLILLKALDEPSGALLVLPYVCVGLGCGIFGHGAGELISRRAMKGRPDAARKLEIEQNDERNVAIAARAKGRAYDIMVPVFGALMVAFALMGVELAAVLLLVAAYLFVCGCGVYYRVKYEKLM